jgi:hypothetical protein
MKTRYFISTTYNFILECVSREAQENQIERNTSYTILHSLCELSGRKHKYCKEKYRSFIGVENDAEETKYMLMSY